MSYYIYECMCHNHWGTAWNSGRPMKCYNCPKICKVTYNDPLRWVRLYGKFECRQCRHRWSSGNSWRGMGQRCIQCDTMVNPYQQRRLKRRGNTDPEKRHPSELCEMCDLLGRDCSRLKTRD